MQWNVLCRPVNWNSKIPDLLDAIMDESPDLLTLQEVPVASRAAFSTALSKHGYKIEYAIPRTGNEGDSSAVAWKSTEFVKLGSRTYADGRLEDKTNVYGLDAVTVRLLSNDYDHNGSIFKVSLTSHHAWWGATEQANRLRELVKLDEIIKSADADCNTRLLGGDFNAPRNEDCIRWMLGETIADGKTTYWTEAQDTAIALGRIDSAESTSLSYGSKAAMDTASKFGINTKYMPARRIDFLFSEGWDYGHRGGWTGDAHTLVRGDVSDHAALIASTL